MHMRTLPHYQRKRRIHQIVIGCVLVVLAGCHSGDVEHTDLWLSTHDNGTTYATGWLIETDGTLEICGAILDSMPLQCGKGIPVTGIVLGDVPEAGVQHHGDITWTDGIVNVEGTLVYGTLKADHVTSVAP
jgi:hypothetical protein